MKLRLVITPFLIWIRHIDEDIILRTKPFIIKNETTMILK